MIHFTRHPDFIARLEHVGNERAPLLVIDNFVAETDDLIDAADRAVYVDIGPVYPGVRAPAPEDYAQAVVSILGPLIETSFGTPWESELDLCAFSMVTTPPALLAPSQRLPHFDGLEAERLAFLHYLCGAEHGGTSFYRHKSTGLEVVGTDRFTDYCTTLEFELAREDVAPAYVDGDTALFERLHSVDAAFNRMIIYRGSALHSGNIGRDAILREDARTGRLTINGFTRLQSPAQKRC